MSLKIEKRLKVHPHMNKKEAIAFLHEEFNVTPHEKMAYRALREARERLIGSEKEQYSKLRGYLFEIVR
ncbi:hypothetical protein PIB30_115646, partial [Stylosanthes scabra]|nr:hypothetical protein [Stylosanthes scabra]